MSSVNIILNSSDSATKFISMPRCIINVSLVKIGQVIPGSLDRGPAQKLQPGPDAKSIAYR